MLIYLSCLLLNIIEINVLAFILESKKPERLKKSVKEIAGSEITIYLQTIPRFWKVVN